MWLLVTTFKLNEIFEIKFEFTILLNVIIISLGIWLSYVSYNMGNANKVFF